MEYTEAIDRIMSLVDYERTGSNTGNRPRYDLDRISSLLAKMGNPHLSIPTVHIAGTKGKGSTTAMVGSVLDTAGYKVGLFTSPHLHTFRERIRIGNDIICEERFAGLVEDIWPIALSVNEDMQQHVTLFEFLTAMAFVYFSNMDVDIQVIEVGLGGRLDSTNIVSPLVCGITSLGLDHTDVLGDTLDKIALEKAGIIKQGVPVITASQEPDALRVLRRVCKEQRSNLTVVGKDILWHQGDSSIHGQSFSVNTSRGDYHLNTPLVGNHQLENASVAIGILEFLVSEQFEIQLMHFNQGLSSVKWPARFEIVSENPMIVVDGAHNPNAAKTLVRAVNKIFPNRSISLVIGVSSGKDLNGLVEELNALPLDRVIVTESRHPRALNTSDIASAFELFGNLAVTSSSMSDALRLATESVSDGGVILVTGSLFIAAECREIINGISPEIYPVFEVQRKSG